MHDLNFIFVNINWAVFNPNVLIYLDPGTGSIIIQAVVAAVVGIGIAVKLFWHRILKFLGIRKPIESDTTNDPKVKK